MNTSIKIEQVGNGWIVKEVHGDGLNANYPEIRVFEKMENLVGFIQNHFNQPVPTNPGPKYGPGIYKTDISAEEMKGTAPIEFSSTAEIARSNDNLPSEDPFCPGVRP